MRASFICLVEERRVSLIAFVHVDDIVFAVGLKRRYVMYFVTN